MRRGLLFLPVLLLIIVSQGVRAQDCIAEIEPNDEPAQAQMITDCANGQIAQDDPDMYVLTVSADEVGRFFTISIEITPATQTLVEVVRLAEDGTATQRIFNFATPDGSLTSTNPVMLTPGNYLLAVSTTGAGEYRLNAIKSSEAPSSVESEPNDSREDGNAVSGDFELSGQIAENEDWFVWTVADTPPETRWQLTARTEAASYLGLRLFDSNNTLLTQTEANEWGQATLSDLTLAGGTYLFRIETRSGISAPYRLSAELDVVEFHNYENEPNDAIAQVKDWLSDDALYGRLGSDGDTDLFRFQVDESQVNQLWEIVLDSNSRQPRRLCLQQTSGVPAHCREGAGVVTLVDLKLTVGEYVVAVSGQPDSREPYTLRRRMGGIVAPGAETEPNDTYRQTTAFSEDNRAYGRFYGDDTDVYHLLVAGQPQLWRIQAVGDSLTRLSYINAAGQNEQSIQANNQGRLRLENLYLLPGSHYVEVRGTSGDYRLIAVPLGPPPPGLELEPNDTDGQANRLYFDEERIGLLNEADDEDFYRFSLASEEHVILTVTSPENGLIDAWIRWGNLTIDGQSNPVAGVPFTFESVLLAGEYEVRLFSPNAADSPYTILLERGNPFAPVTDIEPNDNLPFAVPIPASLHILGTVGSRNDDDWYRLPDFSDSTMLEIQTTERHDLTLYDAESNIVEGFVWNADTMTFTGTLDAVAPPAYLRVRGSGAYDLQLVVDELPVTAPASDLNIGLEVVLDEDTVASHWSAGQVVNGSLRITNNDSASLDLFLDSHSSHHKLNINLLETQVSLSSGEQAELPLQIVVTADLPPGAYALTFRARTASEQQATVSTIIQSDAEANPVAQQWVWSLPESMLGGWNVAALSSGAEIITDEAALAESQQDLHDGYTTPLSGFRSNAQQLPLTLTVKLAGEMPVPVTGILLNPQSEGEVSYKLRDFELWLSVDGQTYTQVLVDSLSPLSHEQAFALPHPILAQYAQLRLLSNHNGNSGNIELGEWKVLAALDWSPDERLNLADPQHGGYIVYNTPQYNQAPLVASTLVVDESSYQVNWPAGTEAEWVLGFHHDRAAQITEIEWIEVPDTQSAGRITELTVWASLESPVGPWTQLGTWILTPGTSSFNLPEPTWVRYLRLTAPAPAQDNQMVAPDAIRIWERSIDDNYRSIGGEWGHYSRNAIYEWLHPLTAFALETGDDTDNSREQAALLQASEQVNGQVQIDEDIDWYQIHVPEEQNAVTLHLTGDPTVRVRAVFEDSDGNPLPASVEYLSSSEQLLTASAIPGYTVYFRIEEPPRSIIFAWDNSGSVSSYYDTIYGSLTTFVEGVTSGREVANFLPFGGELLLDTWGEQPALLQQVLNDYDRSDNASNAEQALLTAVDEMAMREGTKAIIVITDASSGSYSVTSDLWHALNQVRPTIFTLHVMSQLHIGESPASEQDIMQSWASVNSGYYDFVRSETDMETAFERATIWLRRPAHYSFTADVTYIEPPGPGTIQVVSNTSGDDNTLDPALLNNTSVEIILDASWSMIELLNGQRRIDIAREAILELVNDVLPEGTPMALRVFGNREGNFSCRTDLEVPLQPLNRATMQSVIQSITPQNNANTAIADSLALIPEDLAEATGSKIVILLTDGQETCDGDPEAIITALRNRGIDVRINIIGFAIADATLKSQFEHWAQLGGGQYFDASNTQDLLTSLTTALSVSYRVIQSDGAVVATGFVNGEPVSLPAGVYTIELLTEPMITIPDVTIPGEEDVTVELEEQ